MKLDCWHLPPPSASEGSERVLRLLLAEGTFAVGKTGIISSPSSTGSIPRRRRKENKTHQSIDKSINQSTH